MLHGPKAHHGIPVGRMCDRGVGTVLLHGPKAHHTGKDRESRTAKVKTSARKDGPEEKPGNDKGPGP